jgi:MFS family permease
MAFLADMVSKTFYYPTFSNYLIAEYGLNVEFSSLFFIFNMISYLSLIKFINSITKRLGFKLTIFLGLVINSIGILLLPPIGIFPKHLGIVFLGQLILGIPTAFITIPGLCDSMETLTKTGEYDESTVNSLSSTIFIMMAMLGECVGPTLGGYVTQVSDFSGSCLITSGLVLKFAISYLWIYYGTIKAFLSRKGGLPSGLMSEEFFINQPTIEDQKYPRVPSSRGSFVIYK